MRKKINEVFTDLTSEGIFKYLPQYGNMSALQLNLEYVLNQSGDKKITSFLEHFIEDDGTILESNLEIIGSILTNLYKDNWDRIWESITVEYNPIENYDRYEKHSNILSGGHTTERQGSVSETLSGGHTTERQGSVKETTTPFASIENEVKVYAYDSPEPSPSEIQTEKTNGTMEVETSRTGDKDIVSFDNEKKVVSHEGDKDVFQYDDEKSEEDVHIHGNIGVTTPTEMIDAVIKLRQFNITQQMFKDIDKYLTLSVY